MSAVITDSENLMKQFQIVSSDDTFNKNYLQPQITSLNEKCCNSDRKTEYTSG